ncbi:transmembrane protease serine 9-like [Paramacrobiotus metropolitanus]|uniref:transmembrane protease serine 9-like n=1 Tax=Paramacrobiotus metropolitanus TaxID=2943436 RepID=UPI002445BB7E|nr:transmembrane protease serine 9-like [Paramacrobiotus metropolitanus]
MSPLKNLPLCCCFLIAFLRICRSDDAPRLGWDFWLNPNRPNITGPLHVSDSTPVIASTQLFPTPATTQNAGQTLTTSTVLPASSTARTTTNATWNDTLRCGTPRVGFYDPFGLSDLNIAVWTDALQLPVPKSRLTMALTIVGGQDTDPEKICWQAKLHKDKKFVCGASIIGKRTILTASHCVNDFRTATTMSPDRFRVVVGAPFSQTLERDEHGLLKDNSSSCAQIFNVTKVIANPQFVRLTNDRDIALVTLSSDINFADNCVCPVCLSRMKPKVGEMCAVSGYGLEKEGGGMGGRSPRPLKFVRINIKKTVYDNNCYIQALGGKKPNLDDFICAGDVLGEDTCQGDSGGPVVCMDPITHRHYQSGIVSYGKGCGRGIGGMYTRVSNFIDWVKDNAGGDVLGLVD